MAKDSPTEIRDRGYLIRSHRLSDTSLIVEWLCATHGRLTTVAKGALRKKSPFQGKLDLLFLADLSCQRKPRSDLFPLKEVSILHTPTQIRRSIRRLNSAAYFIELIRRTTELDTPIPELFELFHVAVQTIDQRPAGPGLALWFEWQLLGRLGLQPAPEDLRLPPGEIQTLSLWNKSQIPPNDSLESMDQITGIATFLGRTWEQELGRCTKLRALVLTPS